MNKGNFGKKYEYIFDSKMTLIFVSATKREYISYKKYFEISC